MYSIYVHTTPDGKKYVGCTSIEPNKRFQGGCNYKTCTRFNDAINFFGWDNIQHQVLETVEDKETALKREEYYTLLWRTNEPEFGYNIYVGNIPNEYTNNKRYEKMNGRKPHNKPIMIENIKTGEILKFDSRKKCAEFFGISVGPLRKFITCVRQSAFFDDYKVLK